MTFTTDLQLFKNHPEMDEDVKIFNDCGFETPCVGCAQVKECFRKYQSKTSMQVSLLDYNQKFLTTIPFRERSEEEKLKAIKENFCCQNCSRCKFFELTINSASCKRTSINKDHPQGSFVCHDHRICDELIDEGIKINEHGDIVLDNS